MSLVRRSDATALVPVAQPPAGIAPADLAEAVAANRSWRGVLRAFGLTSTHKARALRAYCDATGIDYSHFTIRSWDRADLRTAVEASRSWSELLERLGVAPGSGSARASVRRRCAAYGIDLSGIEGSVPRPEVDHPQCELARLRSAGGHLVAAFCTLAGLRVSWPLEPAPYDLLVEDAGGRVRRVQVKTTTRRSGDSWLCGISRSTYVTGGGKQRAAYEPGEIDDFGIVDGDLRVYLVPAALVTGRSTLMLRRYGAFELLPPCPGGAGGGAPVSG